MEINLDFDGTCVAHEFPNVGKDIGAVPVLKKLIENGHRLILFTMRSDRKNKSSISDSSIEDVTGNFLTEAIQWFEENDIPLYGIQTNPTQHEWTTSPKSYTQIMIDDTALGCPLVYEGGFRPYVDWKRIEGMLRTKGLI